MNCEKCRVRPYDHNLIAQQRGLNMGPHDRLLAAQQRSFAPGIIEFCPLHKAAEEMLDVLWDLKDWFGVDDMDKYKAIKQAIAKAMGEWEGKNDPTQ